MARAPRVVSARELLAQRNVFIALAAALAQDEPGGVLSVGLDALVGNLSLAGGLAYRRDGRDLLLVAEHGVPRKAHAWLKHLTLDDDDPWFAAQRAVARVRPEIDTELAKSRAGVSIAPALREAGWQALAALPVAIGRQAKGVLVVAANDAERFDRELMRVLEAVSGVLALALAREEERERESERLAEAATAQLATVGLVATSLAGDLEGPLRTLQRQLAHQRSTLQALRASIAAAELDDLAILSEEMSANAAGVLALSTRLAQAAGPSEPVTLDLARVTRAAVAMMRDHATARHVEIELAASDGDHAVDGHESELFMLVVQLVMHAVRRSAETPDACVMVSLADEDGRVSLCVQIPPRPRATKKSGVEIFEALMARGGATDIERIGLSLARQTVLAHHGHVEVGPSPHGGTQIRAVLPSSHLKLERPSRSGPPADMTGEERRVILWIDDDLAWTGSLRRFLEGFEVRAAATLSQARSLLAELGAEAAAIFVTVALPDGSGLDLHRESPPALGSRFVFLCDGVLPLDDAAYLRSTGCPTLIEPLTLDEVSALLDDLHAANGRVSGAPTLQPSTSSRPPREPSDPPAA